MSKKILSVLFCLLILVSFAYPALAREYGYTNEIRANAVMLVNIDTGEIILQKNADVQVHPASTTKILAVALAMEMCTDLENTMVTVPTDVWNEFDGLNVSTAGLKPGEELSMYDLLCCMMLQSGNEAASALREFYGGDAFIEMMNQKATELGCTNTHFSNPHGVFADNHYTSARDMMLISKWAMTVPGFWEMSQMARYTKPATNMNEEVTLVTTVLMQDPNSGYYTRYIKGIKTGTTDEAGRCLVSAAQQNGMTYLLVVLGGAFEMDDRLWGEGQSVFTETRLIYDWAFQSLKLGNICDPDTVVAEIALKHASKKDSLLLYPSGELYTVLSATAETEPEINYKLVDVPDVVKAPVAAGQVIGKADVLVDGDVIGQIDLIAREDIELDRFVFIMDTIGTLLQSKPAKIIYIALIVIAALYLYYALVLVPKRNRKRRKKKRSSQNTVNRRR